FRSQYSHGILNLNLSLLASCTGAQHLNRGGGASTAQLADQRLILLRQRGCFLQQAELLLGRKRADQLPGHLRQQPQGGGVLLSLHVLIVTVGNLTAGRTKCGGLDNRRQRQSDFTLLQAGVSAAAGEIFRFNTGPDGRFQRRGGLLVGGSLKPPLRRAQLRVLLQAELNSLW